MTDKEKGPAFLQGLLVFFTADFLGLFWATGMD